MASLALDLTVGIVAVSARVTAAVELLLGLLGRGETDAAMVSIEALNRSDPGAALSSHLVGLLSLRLGEPGKALEAFNLAHRLSPDVAEYSESLSILHAKLGHVVDALYFGKLTTAATARVGISGLVPVWLGNFTDAFFSMRETPLLTRAKFFEGEDMLGLAAQEFRRAIEVDPHSAEGWRGLVTSCQRRNLPFEALEASVVLLEQDSITTKDVIRHGDLLADCGQLDQSIAYLMQTAAALPDIASLALAPIRSLCRRAVPDSSPLGLLAAGLSASLADKPPPAAGAELARRRLRVGVVSSQWRQGNGLDPVVPVLEQLDQRRVELIVYADGPGASILARRLQRRADRWHDIAELDDETLNFVIRNDAPDALIDLDGPIRSTRPGLFRTRPASLILGLYGVDSLAEPLGLDGVILSDRASIDPGSPLPVVLATLATLPTDLPAQIPDYRPHDGGTVFGIAAPYGAITGDTLALWESVLTALPGSSLLLDAAAIGGIDAATDIRAALDHPAVGIFIPTPDSDDVRADYFAAIDVLLDPPDNPFCDRAIAAFGYGVPAFTCVSRNRNAALLSGWLKTIGLDDLVVATPEKLIDTLRPLQNPPARATLHTRVSTIINHERLSGAQIHAHTFQNALTKIIHAKAAPG